MDQTREHAKKNKLNLLEVSKRNLAEHLITSVKSTREGYSLLESFLPLVLLVVLAPGRDLPCAKITLSLARDTRLELGECPAYPSTRYVTSRGHLLWKTFRWKKRNQENQTKRTSHTSCLPASRRDISLLRQRQTDCNTSFRLCLCKRPLFSWG